MPAVGRDPIDITADLRVEVGPSSARITATGDQIHIQSDDLVTLWHHTSTTSLPGGARGIGSPRSIGRIAQHLDAVGLTVSVVGPRGRVVVVGRDARAARWVQRLTGSDHVSLGSMDALRPFVLDRLRPLLAPAAVAAAGLGALLVRRLMR